MRLMFVVVVFVALASLMDRPAHPAVGHKTGEVYQKWIAEQGLSPAVRDGR